MGVIIFFSVVERGRLLFLLVHLTQLIRGERERERGNEPL